MFSPLADSRRSLSGRRRCRHPGPGRGRLTRPWFTPDTGTGFGLQSVEQVADAHGLTIRVTDSDSGGTRVEVTGADILE